MLPSTSLFDTLHPHAPSKLKAEFSNEDFPLNLGIGINFDVDWKQRMSHGALSSVRRFFWVLTLSSFTNGYAQICGLRVCESVSSPEGLTNRQWKMRKAQKYCCLWSVPPDFESSEGLDPGRPRLSIFRDMPIYPGYRSRRQTHTPCRS